MSMPAPSRHRALTARGPWAVVAALGALLVLLPIGVRSLPVPGAGTQAAELLGLIRESGAHAYAGYAETTGSLALPVTDTLTDVASLLGGRTLQRVWWRGGDDWRSDTLSASGELSTRTTPTGMQVFDFEGGVVARTAPDVPGAVRLPRAVDTLPPLLAGRLLSEASAAQVSSLPPRRVAGRSADGLRLTPGDPLSSIERVDVWADRVSGIPLLVEAFGRTSATAAVSSTFLDFTDALPSEQELAFTPPPGTRVVARQRLDLAQAVGRTPDPSLPATLLGFPRAPSPTGLAGIGQYGQGVTQLVVGQLPDRVAASLRQQLRAVVGATALPEGLAVSIGPVGLLVTDPAVTGRTFLLTGTLTPDGLARAAAALRTGAAS